MNRGFISSNSGNGGIVVWGDGSATFTINGGTISGNEGAGILVAASTVIMQGGIISGN